MSGVTALIFAKHPLAGAVKTRMTPPLTGDEAARLHVAALRVVCANVADVGVFHVVPVVSPDDRAGELAEMLAGDLPHLRGGGSLDELVWPQGEGDLGERLARAVDRAFTGGADGVILLGADSPTLPCEWFRRAGELLARQEAVMGPTDDGGYYLLGMRRPLPALLERIDWGGDQVAAQTRDRAATAGVNLVELPAWYDLDRFADLKRAAEDLVRAESRAAKELRELIQSLIERYDGGRPDETEPRNISRPDG